MDGRVIHLWLVGFLASSCGASSDSLVVLVGPPVSVHRGHTTTLPCWLNPPQSAEDLEVRWFRDNDFDSPIILYQGKKVTVNQEASYAGRVSFGLKDTNSDGLKSGDVSLKLENAVIEDIGDYTCYVSSYQGYDSATINLLVTETGAPPLLSAVWTEDNRVNVSCESEGWYPKPALRWLDQTQDLTPGTVLYGNGSSGLVSVSSWVLVKSSSEVSCSIGVPNNAAKEARMRLEGPPAQKESGSSTAGWVAFSLLLVGIILAGLAVMYIRRKGKKTKSDRGQGDEDDPLLPKEISVLSELQQYYVNIQLEDTNNRYITMKGTLLRDAPCDNFPDGQNVTCLTAVKGTSGFSCGRHYWEVSLNNPKLGPKQSWWVGVTSATKIPQKLDPPNTADGFWFLSSSPNRADRFQFSTEPKVFIGCPRPQTVGVFLDYDGGELYFYNVEDTTLIGSFKATFRGEVFPLFNPGKGDQAPLEILHREEVNQSGDERDCVVSVAQ
ncbi:butyrophilin subfamily 1 member A1-like [Amphiprion ocellaris]|uniref:butyrophilin subfamily 1 member A1-like n=1 Tax=Amphiprion ocellaris TaxID=80972 RepID=UPI0024114EA1|nr:butyrophilin subfamily 1 member A1-like [Amphiprion ocellaris]